MKQAKIDPKQENFIGKDNKNSIISTFLGQRVQKLFVFYLTICYKYIQLIYKTVGQLNI